MPKKNLSVSLNFVRSLAIFTGIQILSSETAIVKYKLVLYELQTRNYLTYSQTNILIKHDKVKWQEIFYILSD